MVKIIMVVQGGFNVRIELISPAWGEEYPGNLALFPPLNLATVAALTPAGHEVFITDESVEKVKFDREVDLIGLTAMTAAAPRAYEIAAEFRRRGVPVVMGGIHATFCPEEAGKHVDAVVVGEAEGLWPQVVEDAALGKLQTRYVQEKRPELRDLPRPRRHLYKERAYLTTNTVQTSRGCPHNCSFCSVSSFFGRSYRFRPVQEVVQEVQELPSGLVGFVDDNITGSPSYARELFRALQPLGRRWVSQASLDIGERPELLEQARKSGCVGLFIGFESLSPRSIEAIGKGINKVREYGRLIKTIHRAGIAIEGAFIFGFDDDDPGVFSRTVGFAVENKLAAAQFGILTPLPGTPLYRNLDSSGKIMESDWSKYTISNVVFRPLGMTPQLLQDGFYWAWRKFYSWPSIGRRLLSTGFHMPWLWRLNLAFRRAIRHMPFPRLTLRG